MKKYQILLFIVSTMLFLGVICYIFPREGIKIGPFLLEFPSLEEMLSSNEDEIDEKPEEALEKLLKQQNTALLCAQQDSLEAILDSFPTRFILPDNDPTFFDSLFAALENSDSNSVRIIHYGDSQLEEDRMTSVLRDSIQKTWGGSGQGLMPGYRHRTFSSYSSSPLEAKKIYADRRFHVSYGPYGSYSRLYGNATLTYGPSSNKKAVKRPFNEVTVIAGKTGGSGLRITCNDSTISFPAGKKYVRARFDVPENSLRVQVRLSGQADIYGVLLDSKTGVSMDNIAMRGCSGTIFTAMDSTQLRNLYKDENVKLVFMQYGGNMMPAIHNSKGISRFCNTVRKQIRYIQNLAPEAKIVYIGPSDMSKRIGGRMQTYPKLPELVDSLKVAANAEGAGYWDIFAAMGGKNSMVSWVKARPALAGGDYIHFTITGSTYVSNMMFQSLKMYYKYYLLRKENEE